MQSDKDWFRYFLQRQKEEGTSTSFFDTKVYKLNVVFHSCLSFLEVDNTPPYVACVSQRDLGYII